jgi:putative peptide zinc metalloprotease protein
MVAENLDSTSNTQKKEEKEIYTGILRRDLKITLSGEVNSNGHSSWIIFDSIADKYYKIEGKEYFVLSYLDKNYSLKSLLNKLSRVNLSITEGELQKILQFLETRNLLVPEYGKTDKRIMETSGTLKKGRTAKILSAYMFLRIPICNPDRFLSRTCDFVSAALNKWILLLLALISATGYISILSNWTMFSNVLVNSLNFSGLIRYGCAIAFLKFIHEAAHAYTAKIAGARVRRFGVNIVFFLPRVYTDLTDTWKLTDSRHRLRIDAAGILSELVIGGFFALIWIYSGPGMIKTTAYYIFTTSIINTVLINGNPFVRYDGYYILMDLLKVDNLHKKGTAVVTDIFRKYLFGITPKMKSSYKGMQKFLLIMLSIMSFLYKFVLYSGIMLTVYYKFTKVLGIVLVILQVNALLLKPLIKEVKNVMKMKDQIKKKNYLITVTAAIIILLILFIPLPWTLRMPFEVRSVNSRMIYSIYDGFIDKLLIKNYSLVSKGETLMVQKNQLISFDIAERENEKEILEAELDYMLNDNESLGIEKLKLKQIDDVEQDIDEFKRKEALMVRKSPLTGCFVMFDEEKYKIGKWLNKGEVIGTVFDQGEKVVYAYATSKIMGRINIDDNVNLYINNSMKKYKGKIISINKFPIKQMESSPLLSVADGPIDIIKKAENSQNSYLLMETYYILKIKPDNESIPLERTGYANIRKFSSVGWDFIRSIINILQRELSF